MESIYDKLSELERDLLFFRTNVHYNYPNEIKFYKKCLYICREHKCDEDYLNENFKTFYIPIENVTEVISLVNRVTDENGEDYYYYACNLNGRSDRMFISHTKFKMNLELFHNTLRELGLYESRVDAEKIFIEYHKNKNIV